VRIKGVAAQGRDGGGERILAGPRGGAADGHLLALSVARGLRRRDDRPLARGQDVHRRIGTTTTTGVLADLGTVDRLLLPGYGWNLRPGRRERQASGWGC